MKQPDYVARNQASWTQAADEYAARGRSNWSSEITWGIWEIPEADLGLLPDVAGKDVIELGCGTGYVSGWLKRLGARPVGLDPTWTQLQSAAQFQREFELEYPLVKAAAEAAPFKDASFDLAISEYGAAIWSDPYLWIPEAARLLRPGGELIFLGNANLLMLCVFDEEIPARPELQRDYFGMHRFEWLDEYEGVEFHIPYGEWIRLFRANGFVVEDLVELRPPEDATTTYKFVDLEWARRWPTEEAWKVRKSSG